MRTTSIIAALLASTALAACGGGEDQSADTADTTTAGGETETMATETSGEAMGGDTGMEAEQPAADEAPAEEAPAEEASADEASSESGDMASGGESEFLVAGLTGDPEAGRRVFARCRSCHVLEEGVNRVGPSLYGIVGREAGSVEGFRYSEANANSGVTWTEENLFEYLENPREYIPGTIMAFPGLRDEQDRADVIAYIEANGGFGG
jgi:cytochrome c